MTTNIEPDPRGTTPEQALQLIDALGIRKRLGRGTWLPPVQGGECWLFDSKDGRRIIVGYWPFEDQPWIHASISRYRASDMPSYADLKEMHAAVFPDGHAYQCFVPPSEHISIRNNVLHLWGRADGQPHLPTFGRFGTI